MKSREEAARFAERLFLQGTDNPDKSGWRHFGKIELRELMDFIYGGPPKTEAEKVF